MTERDPFEYDDAAYVLGALDPAEHAAFEAHLPTCAACRERVAQLAAVPPLLAGVTADEAFGADPAPATMLPALLRDVRAVRRRQRWLVGGLATVAAACLVVLLAVLVWPSSTSNQTPGAPSSAKPFAQGVFTAVTKIPMRASATLTATSWGTEIDVHCLYVPGTVDKTFPYGLIALDRDGSTQKLGSWKVSPDGDVDYRTGTALAPGEIRTLVITLPDGTGVLRWKV